jgi:hypothetical protein
MNMFIAFVTLAVPAAAFLGSGHRFADYFSMRQMAAQTTAKCPLEEFKDIINDAIHSGEACRFVLSDPRRPEAAAKGAEVPGGALRSCSGRVIELKTGRHLQIVYSLVQNDVAKNFVLNPSETIEESHATLEVRRLLEQGGFRRGELQNPSESVRMTHRRGNGKLTRKPSPSECIPSLDHDRKKDRLVDTSEPYLEALGVTRNGRPRQKMGDKLRQITKFVEILDGLVTRSLQTSRNNRSKDNIQQMQILDMGSGMGYLTFAAHAHFHRKFGSTTSIHTLGIESRPALANRTAIIAESLGETFTNLSFAGLTIRDYMGGTWANGSNMSWGQRHEATHTKVKPLTCLIALHACDTASDDAIWFGVDSDADIILTAPCCHKQLRSQLEYKKREPQNSISLILEHGIFRERISEMATDSLRAALLDLAGYETRVFEFVGGEHTAKNVMIAAIRRGEEQQLKGNFDSFEQSSDTQDSNLDLDGAMRIRLTQIEEMMEFCGIHTLALVELMRERLFREKGIRLPKNVQDKRSREKSSLGKKKRLKLEKINNLNHDLL